MLEGTRVFCPYCGEPFETLIDTSVIGAQEYVEDCYVCCQPIVFRFDVAADGELSGLTLAQENI